MQVATNVANTYYENQQKQKMVGQQRSAGGGGGDGERRGVELTRSLLRKHERDQAALAAVERRNRAHLAEWRQYYVDHPERRDEPQYAKYFPKEAAVYAREKTAEAAAAAALAGSG